MFLALLLIGVSTHLASAQTVSGVAPGSCATTEKVATMDKIVMDLVTKMEASGLVNIMNSSNPTDVLIPDENLPTLLDLLCNNTESKNLMQQLESEAQACPDLILTATSLQALQIKGVGFAEMFASFGDVNNFCACRAPLPHAWALMASKSMLTFSDSTAAYPSIGAVNNMCGSVLKPVIMSIGGPLSDACKMPLTSQAGFSTSEDRVKLDKMYFIVEKYCPAYSADDWTCATRKSKMAEFKDCITGIGNEVGTKASCSKRSCVMNHLKTCTDEAKEMYIDAVNLDKGMPEIVDLGMSQDCNSATGLQFTVLSLVASLVLLFC